MNPRLEDMNFSVVGTVAVVILAIAYYLLRLGMYTRVLSWRLGGD